MMAERSRDGYICEHHDTNIDSFAWRKGSLHDCGGISRGDIEAHNDRNKQMGGRIDS